MVFLRYIDYLLNGSLDDRRYELITTLEDFFQPSKNDKYRIMDPYLDVEKSIQIPFQHNLAESDTWSFLLASLANLNVAFQIITREQIGSAQQLKNHPPFVLPISEALQGASVEVCQYIDTKINGLALHDRYILKEADKVIKGIHIGPSLSDIHDKDISITEFTNQSAMDAKASFDHIWIECIKNKGWKKG